MKFCKSCKVIFSADTDRCPECGKKLREITDINEPVRLCVTGGVERAMLCGLLKDAEIPYLENNVLPQGVANETVTGYDVKLNNINILVPFSSLPKASELLSSIESLKNDIEPMLPQITAHIERLKSGLDQDEKPMSRAKRTTIKVITAILFLALIALAVFGTDKLMELIKGLFGG